MKRGKRLTVQGVLYPLLQMRMVDVNADRLKDWQAKEAETRTNNARQAMNYSGLSGGGVRIAKSTKYN